MSADRLPKGLKRFSEEAEKILQKGRVQEVEFSQSTYQVKVIDPKYPDGVWSFLQFDQNERLQDSFCSCPICDEYGACPHIAASYLKIFNGKEWPLHSRFSHSFWNSLCQILADSWSPLAEVFHPHEGSYSTPSKETQRNQVTITPSTTQTDLVFAHLLFRKNHETEETSIKFSNLSEEELALWRQGRPSFQLQYELSFWSDLAKWMMQQQEEGLPYTIQFREVPNQLPQGMTIQFQDVRIEMQLFSPQWPKLVRTLNTVDSPLKSFSMEEEQKIELIYNPPERSFTVVHGDQTALPAYEGLNLIPGWIYLPSIGFYSTAPKEFLSHEKIEQGEIDAFLTEYTPFFKSHLVGVPIYDYPQVPNYTVHFDEKWNLHIAAYLHREGDLSEPTSALFGNWVYIENKGFYRLEGKAFPDLETVVPKEEVSHFVRANRAWLNAQEGYKTHVSLLEKELAYAMPPEMDLKFFYKLEAEEKLGQFCDFGEWIYIRGEGFYEAKESFLRSRIFPGLIVPKEEVGSFIQKFHEELVHIPHFFMKESPITRFVLNLHYTEQEEIVVEPALEVKESYTPDQLVSFGDYVYVRDEGFAKVPIDPKISSKYHHVKIVRHKEQNHFIEEEMPSLLPFAHEVSIPLRRPKKMRPKIGSLRKLSGRSHQYGMQLEYETEFGTLTSLELWLKIKTHLPFWISPYGLIYLQGRRFEWLRQLGKNQFKEEGELVLTPWDLIKLHILESPTPPEDPKSLKLWRDLIEERPHSKPNTEGLRASLRPYQEAGLHFLWGLWKNHLSGLLSDDMGLGKTVQALSLLAAIKNEEKKKPAFLIVCPTSVLYHWIEKISSFLPSLNVYVHFGPSRNLKRFAPPCDVLLTTYGTLRSDIKKLAKIPFTLAIYDEVQVAKNHTSLLYQALKQIKAAMRLGLTGTPIENTVRELKAIFDLILPGYMPKDEVFKEIYLIPIEKETDEVKQAQLSHLVKPFTLRRKKEEVLFDLPEKIEEVAHCPLLQDQYHFYQQVVEKERQELSHLSPESAAVHIFTVLMRLKMICNHPACYLKTPADYLKYQSGKFSLFKELLDEALGSNQKVVVFSHFLNMLDIFELYLNHTRIGFSSIRGSTKNRAQEIERFQKDPHCKVFLGSLQASGLGIELTSGNVVIHYDRWWNAAREDQATDRVHRIGQTRGVQVFKLVTLGTLEERIDALIAKKAALMHKIIGTDEQSVLKIFSKEELFSLLADAKNTAQDEEVSY